MGKCSYSKSGELCVMIKKKEYNRHIKNIAFRTAWARSKPLEMPRGLRVWTERKDTILTFKYSDS